MSDNISLTLYRTKEVQTSFIVSQRPSESLDTNWASSGREESEKRLDNVSELSTSPLIPQTHDCWQRQTDEVEGNAVGTSYHGETYLKAKGT